MIISAYRAKSNSKIVLFTFFCKIQTMIEYFIIISTVIIRYKNVALLRLLSARKTTTFRWYYILKYETKLNAEGAISKVRARAIEILCFATDWLIYLEFAVIPILTHKWLIIFLNANAWDVLDILGFIIVLSCHIKMSLHSKHNS